MKKTALATLMVGLLLAGATTSDSALQNNSPTVQLPAAVNAPADKVPEPATMFLFGTGLLSLSALLRRR